MPWQDTLSRLGDALTGVDRHTAFTEGQERRAQVDSAMAQARQRQDEAQMKRMEREIAERLRGMDNAVLTDPTQAPIGDLIVGGFGSDYSSTMQGRQHSRDYQLTDLIADPAQEEAARVAAMEALSPASGVAARRAASTVPTTGRGVEYTLDANGNLIAVTREEAVSQQIPLAPRPGTAPQAPQPTAQQRNIDDLVSRLGIEPELATAIVYGQLDDPIDAYIRLVQAMMSSQFMRFEQADAEARRVVEGAYGGDVLEGISYPLVPGNNAPTNRPPLDSFNPGATAPAPGGRPPLEAFFR